MSDVPSLDFLRLFKVCVDIGSRVLRTYTDRKAITPGHGGSFIRFLSKDNKHKLYHLWKPFNSCCHCPVNFQPGLKKEMQDWMFRKLYDIMDAVSCNHKNVNQNCKGFQYCLCRVITIQTLTLRNLDLSILAFLINNCISSNKNVDDILIIRKTLCHAPSTDSFQKIDLENMWKTLTDSIMALAAEVHDDSTLDLIQDNIDMLKKYDFDEEEIMRLSQEIVDLKKEICQNQNNNSTEVKNEVKKYGLEIMKKIKDECEKARQQTSTEINELKGFMTHRFNELKEILTFIMPKDSLTCKEETSSDKVETDIEVRSDIDEEKVISELNDSKDTERPDEFKLVFAEKKCILLHMTAESDVFKDEESLMSAIQSLIERIIQAGDIDTTEERTLDITFTFPSSLTTEQRRVLFSMIRKQGEFHNDTIDVDYIEQNEHKLTDSVTIQRHKEGQSDTIEVDSNEPEESKPTASVVDEVKSPVADIKEEMRSITSRCIIDMTNAEEATMLSNLQKREITSRKGMFSFIDCQEHCILLELQFNPDEILCNTEALTSAIQCLLEEVNEAGNIDIKHKEEMKLSFTFNGQLTEGELEVIQSVLASSTTTEKINVDSFSIEDLKGTHEDATSSNVEKISFTVTYSELADAESLKFAQAAIPKLERLEYLTVEESNFLRFTVLIQTVATEAVRQRFDQEFPPGGLKGIFNKNYRTLCDLKVRRVITKPQWNMIFPRSGMTPKSANFDFSLMVCFFQYLTPLQRPKIGFDILPPPSDVTLEADLARIKYYRNFINHRVTMKFDSMEMESVWDDVSKAIARIGGEKYAPKCSQLLTKRLADSQSVKDISTTSSTT